MAELVGAVKSARTRSRSEYCSGYYNGTLMTRVRLIELSTPQNRRRYFRPPCATAGPRTSYVSDLAEMFFHGVSTCRMEAVTEQPYGHSLSASKTSNLVTKLGTVLQYFAPQLSLSVGRSPAARVPSSAAHTRRATRQPLAFLLAVPPATSGRHQRTASHSGRKEFRIWYHLNARSE